MKKVVKVLSFAFLGSFFLVSAALASGNNGTTTDVKSSENAIREQVASALSNVSFQDGSEVNVYLSVTPSKGVEITQVSGGDAAFANEVKRTLSTSSITAPANLEGTYLVHVKFIDRSSL